MSADAPMHLFESATPRPDGYRDVAPASLAAASSKPRLIDVREPDEYVGELGHIEGAELVPLATVARVAGAWPRDAALLIVCRSGNRSGRAASQLVSMGFTTVMNLEGGMLAWNAGALPVARS